MSADTPPPAIPATKAEFPSPSSLLVRAAACICAAVLVLVFAFLVYWKTGGAGRDLHTPLPPMAAVALDTVWTLGAAVLLLTRIGVLALPLPRWLVRVGPWLLTALFTLLAAAHLRALAAEPSGDWQIDFQGPLLLLLAGLCIIVASEEPSEPRRPHAEPPAQAPRPPRPEP